MSATKGDPSKKNKLHSISGGIFYADDKKKTLEIPPNGAKVFEEILQALKDENVMEILYNEQKEHQEEIASNVKKRISNATTEDKEH